MLGKHTVALYPIAASKLSLPDLAKHWQRSIAEQPQVSELETLLLQAFWQDTLVMTLPGVPEAQDLDPRVRLLNLCRHAPKDAGLIVVDRIADLPADATVAHNDGSVTVDLRYQIVWPRDASVSVSERQRNRGWVVGVSCDSNRLSGPSWMEQPDVDPDHPRPS